MNNNVWIDSSAYTTGNFYINARLIPENMQELEAMIRRVVAEELAKMFPPEEEPEIDESEEAIRPFIGQD